MSSRLYTQLAYGFADEGLKTGEAPVNFDGNANCAILKKLSVSHFAACEMCGGDVGQGVRIVRRRDWTGGRFHGSVDRIGACDTRHLGGLCGPELRNGIGCSRRPGRNAGLKARSVTVAGSRLSRKLKADAKQIGLRDHPIEPERARRGPRVNAPTSQQRARRGLHSG